MRILKTVQRIPGGLMVIPLLLGAFVNTFFGEVWKTFDGTFTTFLWKSGAMPILSVFIFCNATTIDFRKAGLAVGKGVLLTVVKVGLGILVGLLCGKLFGEAGFLGLSTLAIIGALVNSNGGLYAALAAEYGDATDVGAVSILSINDGPFFTMLALGAAGAANIPLSVLAGCVLPVVVGCILGNLDEDFRKFCAPGATLMIPFFAFPLGAGLDIFNLARAGMSGVVLGLGCVLVTGIGGYVVYRVLRIRNPEVGAAVGTTAGNAAATPMAVAAVDSTLLAVAETATAQITAAIIVTAICCPLLVLLLRRLEVGIGGGHACRPSVKGVSCDKRLCATAHGAVSHSKEPATVSAEVCGNHTTVNSITTACTGSNRLMSAGDGIDRENRYNCQQYLRKQKKGNATL